MNGNKISNMQPVTSNQKPATSNQQQLVTSASFKTLYFILVVVLVGCAPKVKKEVIGIGPSVRVHLATITTQDLISFTGDYYLVAEEARYQFGERNKNLTIIPVTDGVQLFNENRNLLFRQHFPIIMEPRDENSHFIFMGNEYAGTIMFTPASDTSLYLINKLPLEEYLKGVVPAEIFTTKQEWFEAIKVQAICARTYAIKKLEENKSNAFDLYSSVADQVYKGFNIHSELADKAVNETRGIILTYQTKPATVYYHSTCGGQLEAAENVWPERGTTYLKGGIDAVENYYSCRTSPHFRWSEQRGFAQLDSALDKHFHIGMLNKPVRDTLSLNLDLYVSKRNTNGRIEEINISYGDTSVVLDGYNIRRFFAQPPAHYLKSNLFYFTQDSDTTIQLHGGGYGHGVGMCQFGAMNMSERGFRYYHILAKYFSGTTLTKLYQ